MNQAPTPNLMENPIPMVAYKTKKYPHNLPKGMSFLAFLISVLIYISIFYVCNCNLSPLDLLNNSKFWFFISNTLILIIAADYGAFSSSKQKYYSQPDLYEDDERHYTQRRNSSPFGPQQVENPRKSIPSQLETEKDQLLHEKNEVTAQRKENLEARCLEIDIKSDPVEDIQEKRVIFSQENDQKASDGRARIEERTFGRSKSERAKRSVGLDESKIGVLRRSETEKFEENYEVEEENEFSAMSDEELNRRVEAFIQKFNEQIRLQAAQKNKFNFENIEDEDDE